MTAASPKIALCLPGGGVTGVMYQIGALAAFDDCVEGLEKRGFDLYVGSSSGASVAAALAAGRRAQRIYRAILDPADVYLQLERRHIWRVDTSEWRRTLGSGARALHRGLMSLVSSDAVSTSADLWAELDRLIDSLPAGVFTLDGYERFLDDFFLRRGIPNSFRAMPKQLVIMAHDLDSGERVMFGSPGFEHVPVTRACIASMALGPFFSPVRVGSRHYIETVAAQASHIDVAAAAGADVVVVVNPMVPVLAEAVPTGHGERPSVRDKGCLWVSSQANRIGVHALLEEAIARHRAEGRIEIIRIEPDPTDAILFMHNPASFAARRKILEYAYRSTKERMSRWLSDGEGAVARASWRPKRA